jgi:uncharacterized protein (TIGR02271 family)
MPTNIAQPVHKGLTADTESERMLAYNVLDKNNTDIGHVSGLWTEPHGPIAFVGVKTTWLVGKTHVIPAQGMEVNHQRETIRVPYSAEVVKNAPTSDPGEELEFTREVYSYYTQHGMQQRPAQGQAQAQGQRAGQTGESVRMPLMEEQLKIGKREVESGGVRLRKVVHTEPVREGVELRREEAVIERVPAGQGARPSDKAFKEEDIYVPLRREEAVVQKEANVREEVRLRKTSQTEGQQISDQVRKEDVEIEESGEASRMHGPAGTPANRIREQQDKPRSQRQKS